MLSETTHAFMAAVATGDTMRVSRGWYLPTLCQVVAPAAHCPQGKED
jgi:hypothetical protein